MHHSQVQPSMPATSEQIGEALKILFSSMPLPRGSDPERATIGYLHALQGFPIEAIAYGIRKFLRGECEGVSAKFCPHPPELAAIVRGEVHSRPTITGNIYGYHAPKSRILKRGIIKDHARNLVAQGVYPKGSIWCPGDIMENPVFGDLYGPDDEWERAFPLNSRAQAA